VGRTPRSGRTGRTDPCREQPGIPPQGWGTPDSRALQEAETALRKAGSALNGSSVSDAVETALVDDGADVSSIDCPDTETAQISTVVACQGSVDGSDWTYLVHVLDRQGSILITEY